MNVQVRGFLLQLLPLRRIGLDFGFLRDLQRRQRSQVASSEPYLIAAASEAPAPLVIFYSGLDVTKELLYCFIKDEFLRRGISCLIMDTPGVGDIIRQVKGWHNTIFLLPVLELPPP
jgi:hypothetical protein